MKPKSILLYDEQAEQLQNFFKKAAKEADKGFPGLVLGQIARTHDGRYFLIAGYVEHDRARAISATMGHTDAEILTEIPGITIV